MTKETSEEFTIDKEGVGSFGIWSEKREGVARSVNRRDEKIFDE